MMWNFDELRPDQAFLNITSSATRRLFLYSLSDNCVRCPFGRWREVAPNGHHATVKISTQHAQRWRLFDEDQGAVAFENSTSFATVDRPNVGQFGVYHLECNDSGCTFSEIQAAVNVNLSILYFILIIAAVACTIRATDWLIKRSRRRQQPHHQTQQSATNGSSTPPTVDTSLVDISTASADNTASPSQVTVTAVIAQQRQPQTGASKVRLRSLDTFRGIAIVLMIFVNSGGGHYWWMEHATWNGLHVADTVFPSFLWIMGVCIPMSVRSQEARNVRRRTMIGQVFVRSVKLFLLGLFLNTAHGPQLAEIRIMGVLQRFGIAYFAVATLHILLHRPLEVDVLLQQQGRVRRALYDLEHLWPLWLVMVGIVALHLGVVFAMPVPDCPTGYLGPGGLHDFGAHPDCTGGAIGFIDRAILSNRHLYQWSTARSTYNAQQPFDPEGIFGCLLTVVQVFFGLQCGVTLMVYARPAERLLRWCLWSIVCGLVGGGLAHFSQDDGWIPVNKNMWSVSYVLVTTSLAFALLAVCYWAIDVQRWWSGAPLRWAGMNAIVMYVGHELLHQILPFRWRIGPMNTHLVLLVENGWNAGMWMGVAWLMYRRKWFVSV